MIARIVLQPKICLSEELEPKLTLRSCSIDSQILSQELKELKSHEHF